MRPQQDRAVVRSREREPRRLPPSSGIRVMRQAGAVRSGGTESPRCTFRGRSKHNETPLSQGEAICMLLPWADSVRSHKCLLATSIVSQHPQITPKVYLNFFSPCLPHLILCWPGSLSRAGPHLSLTFPKCPAKGLVVHR